MPRTLTTWGDRIRKRRLELGLYQREVAERLGVDTTTVYNWEQARTGPTLRAIPKIIEFLGYAPELSKPTTLGERIRMTRKLLGKSQKELARKIRIDPSTLGRREKDVASPSKRLKKRLDEFLLNHMTKSEGAPQA